MSAFSHYKLLKNLVGTVFVFCFLFPRALAHGVEGVAETYRKEQVGSAFYRQPCDCKESV